MMSSSNTYLIGCVSIIAIVVFAIFIGNHNTSPKHVKEYEQFELSPGITCITAHKKLACWSECNGN